MKILLLAKYLPNHGSTISIYITAIEMTKRGHNVFLMSAGHDNKNIHSKKLFDESVDNGVKHIKGFFPKFGKSKFKLVLSALIYLVALPINMFKIIKLKPDIIDVQYPVTSHLAKIYGIFFRCPFIVTYRSSGIPKHALHRLGHYGLAISSELEYDLINRLGYQKNQVKVIFNGAHSDKIVTNEEKVNKHLIYDKYSVPCNKTIISYVGSFNHRKGLDILFRALHGLDAEFHIVLMGDGDFEFLNRHLQDNKLMNKTTILSYQNPRNLYAISDIFVLPSRNEGFANVTVESMINGVATIRSNTAGAYDQIIHGETGFIFENESINQLSNYLQRILHDSKLRNKIAQKGSEAAKLKFSKKKQFDDLENFYQNVIRKF